MSPQIFVVGAMLLGYLLGFVLLMWWRAREERRLWNDIDDLHLSPEELEAKYHVEWTESPPGRPQDGVAGPENSTPPSRPPAAGEEH
jgi:hypothetical protein